MKNWPVLKQVLAAYKDKGVAGILHIFPLPYVYVYSRCFACELFELVHGGFWPAHAVHMRLSQNDDHPCNPPHPSIRYHHNAYFVQQAGVVVRQQDLGKFVEFVELIFANQDSG